MLYADQIKYLWPELTNKRVMKDTENHKLLDLLHEFLIMFIVGLGVALPVIFINFMDIMTQINMNLNGMSASMGGF